MQLWERTEGLPVRRHYHKKLRHRIRVPARSLRDGGLRGRRPTPAMHSARKRHRPPGGRSLPVPAPGETARRADSAGSADGEFGRILLFPLEVVHSRRDRGPAATDRRSFRRWAQGRPQPRAETLALQSNLPFRRSIASHGASTPGFMRNVAREFGAEFYLTGAVRYAGNQVRRIDAACAQRRLRSACGQIASTPPSTTSSRPRPSFPEDRPGAARANGAQCRSLQTGSRSSSMDPPTTPA